MDQIVIHEVGPRDGLQMEKATVPTETKIAWVVALFNSGLKILQLGSFVHPVKVPQMADTDALFRYFKEPGRKPSGVTLSGLVLNEKGLERGLACGVEMFCMGVSASETHSRKNTGMGRAEALERILAMAETALREGRIVQVSVQSAFGCGYEGAIPEEAVLRIVERYLSAGLRNISLADTAGHADPVRAEKLFERVLALDPAIDCASHFHNTFGMGLANCMAAYKVGVRCFESSVGGLGGCPFTAIAGGNVSTEDLVHMFQRIGLASEIRLAELIQVAGDIGRFFNRDLPGSVYRTGPISDAVTVPKS